MENKLLTIAIPSYNAQDYLDRCIQSLINEKTNEYIEILIINDGSIDKTKEKGLELSEKYLDIVKLINKTNGGHGSAVNTGIKNAIGKYFRVIDADDWVDNDSFIKYINLLKNIDVDLVSTHYNRVNMNTGVSTAVNETGVEYNRIYQFEELDQSKRYYSLASTSYRTDILKQNNILLQENIFYVDVEFQIMPIPFIKTVCFFDLSVYRYMIGNITQSISYTSMVRRYDHHDMVVKRMLQYITKTKMSEAQFTYVKTILLSVLNTHYYINIFYNPNKEEGIEKAIEFDEFLFNNHRELYEKLFKEFKFLKVAKKYNFDTSKAERDFLYRLLRKIKNIFKKKIN